jgi:signal transduction histidine kinase
MIWISSKWGGRLLPGTLMAIAIAGLLKLGVFDPLEQTSYRLLFQLRGALLPDQRLVMVEIDDASLERLGRFPWSRQQYARLLDLLAQPGAISPPAKNNNIVVLDLLFSEPSASDTQLAAAMKRHGQVVLASAWDADGKPLMPVPQLRRSAIATGHILTQADSDGIVRSVIPLLKGQPTLGVAAMQARSLVQAKVTLPPLDRPLWLNWINPVNQAPHYSFADVIEGKVNPQAFHQKMVLVGVTATGIDPLVTPFNQVPPASSLYLHATLIQNLLQHNLLHPLSSKWLLLMLLSAPLCSWSLTGWGLVRQSIGTIGLCWSWGIVSLWLFYGGYLSPLVAPMALFITTGCATALCDRIRETGRLQRQLQSVQQNGLFKEEFLRTATHELRSPVANMQNVLTMLKIPSGRGNLQQYIELLEVECQREMDLVNDLLDLQRLEASVDTGQLEQIDWHDWLQEVALPFLVRADVKQQMLTLKVAPNLPTVVLEGASLRRLLAELLNNACKYSPAQAEIGIVAQFHAPEIALQIYNTGAEILPEDLPRIFEPFYRAPDQASREAGTGLGLAIVKKLAERLDGEIQVNSRSQTTTFTLRFPVSERSLPTEPERLNAND